jgi:hypothetical protein
MQMSCSICLCDDENELESLPCGHSFHSKCIISWLLKNNTCPICRFTESEQQEDSNNVSVITQTEFRSLLSHIASERNRENIVYRRNLRYASNANAPSILKRKVERLHDLRNRSTITKQNLKDVNNQMKFKRKELGNRQSLLYKHYLQQHKQMQSSFKEECKEIRKQKSSLQKKNTYEESKIQEIKNTLSTQQFH